MTTPPTISVLMPVYNREKLVVEAIRSIQNQTFQNWELIILDDASTDASLDVCRLIAKEDSRIRVYGSEKNMGVAASRNTLTTLARGKYIAHQDSDDVSVPERLEWQLEVLETNPETGMVCGICEWVDMAGNPLTRQPELLVEGKQFPQNRQELVRLLYRRNDVQNPACMYPQTILTDIPGPFDPSLRMSCDWRFTLDVAHRYTIFGIPKVLVRMRRGKGHEHLWKDRQAGFAYTKQCLRTVYQDYKHHGAGLSYFQYRRAIADHLLWDYGWSNARFERLVKALVYDPTNTAAWKEIFPAVRQFGRKLRGALMRRIKKLAGIRQI